MPRKSQTQFLKTSEVIEIAKISYGIDKPNSSMTDAEIKTVIRLAAHNTPGTCFEEGKLVFSLVGIGVMLFLTLMEFPDFYNRHGLSQFN